MLLALALVAPTGWLALLPLLRPWPRPSSWRYSGCSNWTPCAPPGAMTAATRWPWWPPAPHVMVFGIEAGVIVGVLLSMANLIWRASRPHIAVLGRIAGSEHFRNINRYPAETIPDVLMLRIDANLFFGNVEAVSARVEDELEHHPATRHLVLVMTAVSEIDTTALFSLAALNQSLRQRGIGLHLAEVKGPVMDRLKQSELLKPP
ncbi:sodium-independent anion transporter [Massilia sp. B-10]|nr:sodium-independent anion transporter [Massilia sp. B-10]